MKPATIATFVLLIFSGVLLFVLVLPKWEEVGSARERLSKQEDNLLLIKSKFERTKQAISQFRDIPAEDIATVNSALPDEADLPNLLVLVDLLIDESGLVGEDINISVAPSSQPKSAAAPLVAGSIAPKFLAPQETGGPQEARVSFSVVGSYGAFKDFLVRIEKSLRIFDMASVSFSSPQKSEIIPGAFRFGVNMKTYYSAEKQNASSN